MDLCDLPQTIQDLAEAIGIEGAMALVEVRGGTSVRIPVEPAADHWLREALGEARYAQLVRTYAGELIDIPVCSRALAATRRARAIADLRTGQPQRQVALRYGYTERYVRILAGRSRA
jgi:hypothetical protein